ncbi:aldo/keto reductase [Sabulicella rubraurantiaca]|uniref:aldo/keto reductase n=1 Tax=Sabulicella rubraurantiaca TaxID=2811429 RepID=UPI001A965636|nr:aldo/keto reductase [Sabulicella rubraurantiaca]
MMLETKQVRMPALGLGTWPMRGADCEAAVESALALGYRHLDTAEMYGNEREVGTALRRGGVPREEVFVTTKIWWDRTTGPALRTAALASLERLGLDHVDLLLIHWPSPQMDLPSLLEALARLREEGRAGAVGVSNFPAGMLRRALDLRITPLACVQVEHHVMLDQSRLLAVTDEAGMVLSSYTPLGKGDLLDHSALRKVAAKHGATPAQVALAAILSRGRVAAIPKAQGRERQRENLGALGLRLDEEDRATLAALPQNRRFVQPDFAPDWKA